MRGVREEVGLGSVELCELLRPQKVGLTCSDTQIHLTEGAPGIEVQPPRRRNHYKIFLP